MIKETTQERLSLKTSIYLNNHTYPECQANELHIATKDPTKNKRILKITKVNQSSYST